MRIQVDNLSFSTPEGFKDVTSYAFRAKEDKEDCEVDGAALPEGVGDLDKLLAERRGEIEDGMPDAIVIDREGSAVLDGLPARTLVFTLIDDADRYKSWLTLALDTSSSYVQIAYSARADNDLAPGRAVRIVERASFTLTESSVPAGWVRRWAGKLWLDLPEHLAPPRAYRFLSPDETTRIEVSFVGPSAEPSIDSELARDTARGFAVKDRAQAAITTPHVSGTLHSFTLTRTEDSVLTEDVVRRAHLYIRDVPVIHVFGRAPSIDATALDATVDVLIKSIEKEAQP